VPGFVDDDGPGRVIGGVGVRQAVVVEGVPADLPGVGVERETVGHLGPGRVVHPTGGRRGVDEFRAGKFASRI